jgi:hypothetical protein
MWRLLLYALLLWSGEAPAQKAAVTWYKVMKGYIDKYPVTMYLFCSGNEVQGQYYYEKTGKPIGLTGTLIAGRMTLSPSDSETFKGHLTDSTFYGSWSLRKTALPFRLHERTREYLPFLNIWVKGGQKRRIPSKTDPGGASYEASIIWPADVNPMAPFLKKEIFTMLEVNDSGGITLGKALQKQKTDFLKTSYEDEKGGTSPYQRSLDLDILYQDSKILSLEFMVFEYMGGAHGHSHLTQYTYDVEHSRRMSLTEVLDTIHYGEAVSRLIEAQYRKDNGLNLGVKLSEAGEDPLLTDSIPLTTNFYLTAKGIGFLYNEYEIGDYALGPVAIFIPYPDLMPYLQPAFKAWMHLAT